MKNQTMVNQMNSQVMESLDHDSNDQQDEENIIRVPYCSDEVLKEIIKKNPGQKIVNPVGKELSLDETGK